MVNNIKSNFKKVPISLKLNPKKNKNTVQKNFSLSRLKYIKQMNWQNIKNNNVSMQDEKPVLASFVSEQKTFFVIQDGKKESRDVIPTANTITAHHIDWELHKLLKKIAARAANSTDCSFKIRTGIFQGATFRLKRNQDNLYVSARQIHDEAKKLFLKNSTILAKRLKKRRITLLRISFDHT